MIPLLPIAVIRVSVDFGVGFYRCVIFIMASLELSKFEQPVVARRIETRRSDSGKRRKLMKILSNSGMMSPKVNLNKQRLKDI